MNRADLLALDRGSLLISLLCAASNCARARQEPALRFLCVTFFCCLSASVLSAQNFSESVVYDLFSGSNSQINWGLIQGANGDFYGADAFGGGVGDGFLFKLTPSGKLTTLDYFCAGGGECTDGVNPTSLVQGPDGLIYGVTQYGGTNNFGEVFRILADGEFQIVHAFSGADGSVITYPPVLGSDGAFYGTAPETVTSGGYGGGVVYRLTTDGTFLVLHSFCSSMDPTCTTQSSGFSPQGPLVQGPDGTFYGENSEGGAYGYGNVFSIDPTGTTYKVLRDSTQYSAAKPYGGLIMGSDGNLYGTGSNMFRITTAGLETDLPGLPGPLTLASDGNFYSVGSSDNTNGVFYKDTYNGAQTAEYTFCSQGGASCTDGSQSVSNVLQAADGDFYGQTSHGGSNNTGVVYQLAASPALPAPVQLSPSSVTLSPGTTQTFTFKVLNAFSLSMQQCYAFSTSGDNINPLGQVTGKMASGVYSGSFKVGSFGGVNNTVALTCGGTESGYAVVTVNYRVQTTTDVVVSPSPAYPGDAITLTSTVAEDGGGVVPAGTVNFYYGIGTLLGSATLNNVGIATFTGATSGLVPGTYPVHAFYPGDTGHYGSVSPTVGVTLAAPIITKIALTSSQATVTQSGTVTFSATVSAGSGSVVPTGTVTFSSAGLAFGTEKLNSSGVAKLHAPARGVPAGTYAVTATYSGDNGDASSASSPINVKVE